MQFVQCWRKYLSIFDYQLMKISHDIKYMTIRGININIFVDSNTIRKYIIKISDEIMNYAIILGITILDDFLR